MERERTKRATGTRARKVIKDHLIYMTKSDLYIHGSSAQLQAIKKTVLTIAQHFGCPTNDESDINIPLGAVMQLLTGDALHLGLLIGMNTEDPQCVVLRFECKEIVTVYDALLECFGDIEIEVDEDVEDVPWPFE